MHGGVTDRINPLLVFVCEFRIGVATDGVLHTGLASWANISEFGGGEQTSGRLFLNEFGVVDDDLRPVCEMKCGEVFGYGVSCLRGVLKS